MYVYLSLKRYHTCQYTWRIIMFNHYFCFSLASGLEEFSGHTHNGEQLWPPHHLACNLLLLIYWHIYLKIIDSLRVLSCFPRSFTTIIQSSPTPWPVLLVSVCRSVSECGCLRVCFPSKALHLAQYLHLFTITKNSRNKIATKVFDPKLLNCIVNLII